MRKTISEYGRIILMAVVVLIVGGLIFGLVWADQVKEGIKDPDVIEVASPSNRKPPVILVQDQATTVGKEINIANIYSAKDADGNDISDRVIIECDENVYNKSTKIFKALDIGLYQMTFKVTDESFDPDNKYFLTATEKINILVDNSTGKNTITIVKKEHGTITTSSSIVSAGDNINLSIAPDDGYKFNGASFVPANKKLVEIKDGSYFCPYCAIGLSEKFEECVNCKERLYYEVVIDASTTSFIMPDYDIILTPSWVAEEYDVMLNLGGGTLPNNTNNTIRVTYASKYGQLPTPIRIGYSFVGWFNSNDERITEDTIVTNSKAHEIYAKWNVNSYIITYDANGGTVTNKTKNVSYGNYVGDLEYPVKPGYIFAGWYLSTNDNKKITASDKYLFDTDITLKARWVIQTFTVTFNPNGGTVSTNSISGYRFGLKYGDLPMPVRAGYIFDGWFTSKDANQGDMIASDTIYSITVDQTLYAHWSEGSIVYVDSAYSASQLAKTINDNNYNDDQRVAYIDGDKVYMVFDRSSSLGESGAFSSDEYKEHIVSLSIGNNCTSIANNAFNECINLNGRIYIHENIQSIGSNAFNGTSVDDVVFATAENGKTPRLVKIDSYAFANIKYNDNPVELILPDSVTTIGNNAFENNTLFGKTLEFPENLTSLGAFAFAGCTSFNGALKIPGGITNVPDSVFKNCTGFTSLQIPDTVTSVGKDTFSNCTNIKKIILPISLSTTDGSFRDCKANYFTVTRGNGSTVDYTTTNGAINLPWNVTSEIYTVEISNDITNIGANIFTIRSSDPLFYKFILPIRTKLNSTSNGKTFASDPWISEYEFTGTAQLNGNVCTGTYEGLAYSETEAKELPWNRNIFSFKATFKNGITAINSHTLYKSKVSNVIIEDSVSKIYSEAFADSPNLTNLTIPITIDCADAQFADKYTKNYLPYVTATTSLLAVNFTQGTTNTTYGTTSGVSVAGKGALSSLSSYNSPWITSTTNNLKCSFAKGCKIISDRYCYGTDAMTDVVFNPDLESIGGAAFDGSKNIKNITIANSTKYETGSFALLSLKLNSVTLIQGKNIDGSDKTPINYNTSSNEDALSYTRTIWYLSKATSGFKVILDDSISAIGKYTFYNANYEFMYRSGNNNQTVYGVRIPDNTRAIGAYAFASSGLPALILNSNLEYIDEYAFANNTNMTSIDTVKTSDTTADLTIENYAFRGSNNLKTILLVDSVVKIGNENFNGCALLTSFNKAYDGSSRLPASIQIIGANAFKDCSNLLLKIDNCDNLKSIGSSAFENSKAQSVSLPSTMESLGNSVFKNCGSLTDVDMGNINRNCLLVSYNTFDSCTNLVSVKIPNNIEYINTGFFKNCVKLKELNKNGENSKFNIPTTVQSIGTSAFLNCYSAEFKLTSHDSLKLIFESAFAGSGINEIKLNANILDESVFAGCDKLKYADLSGITCDLQKSLFAECVELESVILPDKYITSIPENCFIYCSKLSKITITGKESNSFMLPDTVITIGDSAFGACESLPEINISKNIKAIGANAFSICSSITNVIIPNSVETIGEHAFAYCKSLTDVTISNNVFYADTHHGYSTGFATVFGLDMSEKEGLIHTPVENIILDDSVIEIPDLAFVNVENGTGIESIKNITLSNKTEKIGEGAFAYTDISEIFIPENVKEIGDSVFLDCPSLKAINVDGNNKYFTSKLTVSNNGVREDINGILCNKNQSIIYRLPEAHPITSIVIPYNSNVLEIKPGAFYNCDNLIYFSTKRSIIVHNNAFTDSENIKQIYFNGNVIDLIFNLKLFEFSNFL